MVRNRVKLGWNTPEYPAPPKRNRATSEFVLKQPLAWTTGVAFRDGKVTLGGSPWTVTVVPVRFRPFARKLFEAKRSGITPSTDLERDAAVFLLDLGIADPLPVPGPRPEDVDIVIPVYRHVNALEKCLISLAKEGMPVTVVDDASPASDAARIRKLAEKFKARLIVHEANGGPGAARNTGFELTTRPFVAFLDADVIAAPDWISRIRPLFNDPLIGAIGPRVLPDVRGTSKIELYEETRSELDMGAEPSRMVYGVPVGWMPSASVIVRRSAVTNPPFEPGLRIGEDVDLFWRMEEAGWTVRYVTDVVNRHEVRASLREFASRRMGYGSSAADLEARHPRRLIPANPSLSGLAVLAALALRKPGVALGVAGYEFARQLRILGREVPPLVTAELTAKSLWSDAFWLGHLLRRDWWPVGLVVLLASGKSKLARGAAAAMLWEPVRDHLVRPTRLGPVESLALRAVDDASYGTGVIRNAISRRVLNVVLPRVRIPLWPKRK